MIKISLFVFALLMSNLHGMDSHTTKQLYSALYNDSCGELLEEFLKKAFVMAEHPYLLHDYLNYKLQNNVTPSYKTIRLLLDLRVTNPSYVNKNGENVLDIARKFTDTDIRDRVIATIDLYIL